MEAYSTWTSMYSPEMENLDHGNLKHLNKLALILHVFDKEVSAIKNHLVNEYQSIQLTIQNETAGAVNTQKKSPNFAKPTNMRLKKLTKPPPPPAATTSTTNNIKAVPKDSPDIFQQTLDVNSLNQNINLSDNETIMSSPEKFSPKIKTKRILRLNKTKELAEYFKPELIKTPKANKVDLVDDFIESTPEVQSFKKSARTSTRKKLFERNAPPKASQSMHTLTQMYNNESLRSKSASGARMQSRNNSNYVTVLQEINESSNNTLVGTQDSYISINDLLAKVSNTNDTKMDETEICNTFKVACEKRKCRQCDMKGSPCRKHMLQVELKEPNETFSGFWDLNFTTDAKKPKMNEENIDSDDSHNSTIYG